MNMLLVLFLSTCGCSVWIDSSGTDLGQFPSKDSVRSFFGNPQSSGILQDTEGLRDTYPENRYAELLGLPYDEFVISTKVAHEPRLNGITFGMTLGLGELVTFPWAVISATNNLTYGTRVRFVYDQQAKVVHIFEDGDWYHGPICTR
jgi:hypothetical protein